MRVLSIVLAPILSTALEDRIDISDLAKVAQGIYKNESAVRQRHLDYINRPNNLTSNTTSTHDYNLAQIEFGRTQSNLQAKAIKDFAGSRIKGDEVIADLVDRINHPKSKPHIFYENYPSDKMKLVTKYAFKLDKIAFKVHSASIGKSDTLRAQMVNRLLPYTERKDELDNEQELLKANQTISSVERRRLIDFIKQERKIIKSLFKSTRLNQLGELVHQVLLTAIDVVAGEGGGSAGALNFDGVCAWNAVVLAIMNLKQFPELIHNKTDNVSQAFIGMDRAAKHNYRHIFDITLLRKAIGPHMMRIEGEDFASLGPKALNELIDVWPPLKKVTTVSQIDSNQEIGEIHHLIALRNGTFDDLLDLNSFKLSRGPSVLLFRLMKLPEFDAYAPVIAYPRQLEIANKTYHLKSVINKVEGHATVTLWREDGKCVRIDNGLRTRVACSPTQEANILVYEDRPGYMGKELTLPRFRLTPEHLISAPGQLAVGAGAGLGLIGLAKAANYLRADDVKPAEISRKVDKVGVTRNQAIWISISIMVAASLIITVIILRERRT